MKTVNTIVTTIVLWTLFATPVIADCQAPNPGQIPTVPCSNTAQSTNYGSNSPSQAGTEIPAAARVDVIYVAEAALHALLSF